MYRMVRRGSGTEKIQKCSKMFRTNSGLFGRTCGTNIEYRIDSQIATSSNSLIVDIERTNNMFIEKKRYCSNFCKKKCSSIICSCGGKIIDKDCSNHRFRKKKCPGCKMCVNCCRDSLYWWPVSLNDLDPLVIGKDAEWKWEQRGNFPGSTTYTRNCFCVYCVRSPTTEIGIINTEREYTEKECAILNASLIVPPCNCEELSKEYWNITFDRKITDASLTQEWRKRKR